MIAKSDFDPQCITYSQMNLIFNSQMYYVRLTIWIRVYILSRFLGIGTADELFGRLYTEALDQADMLKVNFGRENAALYSQMLGRFVIILRDYISAQLEGDTEAMAQNNELLQQNISERAAFLTSLNPYWNESEYGPLLTTYKEYILEIVDFYADQDYDRDFVVYDRLRKQIELIGYIFAEGLYNYITSGTGPGTLPPQGEPCITYEQLSAIFVIRMFWIELNTWIRNYMLSRYVGLGLSDQILDRLKGVPVEFVGFLRLIFSEAAGDEYVQLFENYIDLIDQFITAQMENNATRINEITQQLFQNADARAALFVSLNPYLNEGQWRNMMRNNVRTTINESTTFLTGNYARNIEIFSSLLDQAENMGNAFTDGLLRYRESRTQALLGFSGVPQFTPL
ncbi:MAG TPA: hypothetical protein VN381_05420 [Anaerovoracaceae bacterium]|nr:hypothetical protein [Anaerovoracaceae bacterium]